MKDVNNLPPLMAEGKNSTNIQSKRTKGFGYQVLGFGAGGTASFIEATGGTITESGDFKIHTFTGSGTFCVSTVGTPATSDTVSYMVVAGGGGGGYFYGGAGGAGGYRESKASSDCYTASPLNATCGAPGYNLPVSVQGYPITVGGGGPSPSSTSPGSRTACQGGSTIFSTITSAGGGGGSGGQHGGLAGGNGGSGGGGGGSGPGVPHTGGSGNTPPVSPAQGTNGESTTTPSGQGGAGGGATAAGGVPGENVAGAGAGTGINPSPCVGTPGPCGSLRYFAGGGGGSNPCQPGGPGGGSGGPGPVASATANTGGGQGGCVNSGGGGSGIVIIRYKYQ